MDELVMNGSSRKRRPKVGDVLSLDRDSEGRPVEATVFAQYIGVDSTRAHVIAVFDPIPHERAKTARVSELRFGLYGFTELGVGVSHGMARIVGAHPVMVPLPTQFRSPVGFARDNRTITHWSVRPPRRILETHELTEADRRAPIQSYMAVQDVASLALQGWRPEHSIHNLARLDESRRHVDSYAHGTPDGSADSGTEAGDSAAGASSEDVHNTGVDSMASRRLPSEPDQKGDLSAKEFWQLFVHVDRAKLDAGLEEEALEELTRQLSLLPKSTLICFEDQLAARLHALDTRAHFEAGFDGGGGPDSFLYQRCYVVARGREYYDRVLADPGQMPDSEEQWCETLLYTASAAWRLQSGGDDWDHVPEISYETGSNASGW